MTDEKLIEILEEATHAGCIAGDSITPVPMSVDSPGYRYFVIDGVCGFAWINIPAHQGIGRAIAKRIRQQADPSSDNYGRQDWNGWRRDSYLGSVIFWVSYFNQSYTRKMAFARAFAKVLQDHGEIARPNGRLN